MLKYNELKKGAIFLLDGEPYEVLEYGITMQGQHRRPVASTKIKNLKTGVVISRNFQQSEEVEEAELETREIKFIYSYRGKYIFSELDSSSKRFQIPSKVIGKKRRYLKENAKIEAILFGGEIINIKLPIKMNFKVIECPPSFKGDTAQAGAKTAILETGAEIDVPMFIKVGDIIRVNTEENKYVERVKEK